MLLTNIKQRKKKVYRNVKNNQIFNKASKAHQLFSTSKIGIDTTCPLPSSQIFFLRKSSFPRIPIFFKDYSLQKQTKTSQAITVTCRQIITEYSGLEHLRPVFLNLVCQSLPDASVHRGCLVGNGEIRFAAGSAGTLARIVYTVAIVTEQRAFISVSSSYVAPPLEIWADIFHVAEVGRINVHLVDNQRSRIRASAAEDVNFLGEGGQSSDLQGRLIVSAQRGRLNFVAEHHAQGHVRV